MALRVSTTEFRRSMSAYLKRVAQGEMLELTVQTRTVAWIVPPGPTRVIPSRMDQKEARAHQGTGGHVGEVQGEDQ